MRYLRTPFFAISIISLVLLLLEWHTILQLPEPGTDFSIYYRAAGQFGANPSGLYHPFEIAFDQYLYPPPSIFLFRFFHLFPEHISYCIFIILMYGCLIAALLIAQSLWGQKPHPNKIDSLPRYRITAAGTIIFALASAPVYHNISLGQIECLVLLLSMLYLYYCKSRPWLAGLLLAAAIWIKMYPVLLLFPALFSREGRKTIMTCLVAGIGILVVTLPFIPGILYIDFIKKLEAVSHYTSAHIINQSVIAMGERGIVPFGQFFLWPNIYRIPGWLEIVNFSLLAVIIVLAGFKAASETRRAGDGRRSRSAGRTGDMRRVDDRGRNSDERRVGDEERTGGEWRLEGIRRSGEKRRSGGVRRTAGDNKRAMANPLLLGSVMLSLGAIFSPLGWGHTFVFSLPLWIIGMKKIDKAMAGSVFSYVLLPGIAILLLIPVYNHPAFLDKWPAPIQDIYYSRFLCISLFLIFYCILELPQQPKKTSSR